ncbi:bifunctional DNA primase/polymerase [Streptomyces sp. NPDC008139]|uniref:bifunctional DNA primase/polymerase n=1 Tax=Streptomyces sp. NPDC008139 TaxID=3364814 RepID=UPI0036E3824F
MRRGKVLPLPPSCPEFVRFRRPRRKRPVPVDAMDEWQGTGSIAAVTHAVTEVVTEAQRRRHTSYVTPEGAEWLASASAFPRSVRALWSARPTAPSVLPCGTAFDVVNLSALFGRRVLEQLWASGPGSGPVAVHRGRLLLLVAPGTAQRLPYLLDWEEWGEAVPPMLCHGTGDAVTVPPLYAPPDGAEADRDAGCDPGAGMSRWLVAPDTRHPWLPGADVVLWACVRAARSAPAKTVPALVSTPGTA